jgi:hypothetical protein
MLSEAGWPYGQAGGDHIHMNLFADIFLQLYRMKLGRGFDSKGKTGVVMRVSSVNRVA